MKTAGDSKNELMTIPSTEHQKGIENHKRAAAHVQTAAQNHLKAAQSTIVAQGHVNLAIEAQNKDTVQHAIKG